jgi:hypothetical protein
MTRVSPLGSRKSTISFRDTKRKCISILVTHAFVFLTFFVINGNAFLDSLRLLDVNYCTRTCRS